MKNLLVLVFLVALSTSLAYEVNNKVNSNRNQPVFSQYNIPTNTYTGFHCVIQYSTHRTDVRPFFSTFDLQHNVMVFNDIVMFLMDTNNTIFAQSLRQSTRGVEVARVFFFDHGRISYTTTPVVTNNYRLDRIGHNKLHSVTRLENPTTPRNMEAQKVAALDFVLKDSDPNEKGKRVFYFKHYPEANKDSIHNICNTL